MILLPSTEKGSSGEWCKYTTELVHAKHVHTKALELAAFSFLGSAKPTGWSV